MNQTEDIDEYPKEFDTKQFIDFIKQRFGTPVMAEEELISRFAEFVGPREGSKEVPNMDIENWYQSVVKEVESKQRPLDVLGRTDISNPHGDRKPSMEKRLMDQERDVSMASGLLKQQHTPKKPEDKRPRPPVLGDE